jgi:hypothetical protein
MRVRTKGGGPARDIERCIDLLAMTLADGSHAVAELAGPLD